MATTKDKNVESQAGAANGAEMTPAADGFTEVGKNIQWQMQGDMLVVVIDMTKKFGMSASGKSETIATTGGNVPIGETGISLGVNAYIKVKK